MQTWVFVPDLRATSWASLQASCLRRQRLSASPGPFNPHRSMQMFPLKIMDLDHTQTHVFWDFREVGEHVKKDWKNNYIYVKLPRSLCVCVQSGCGCGFSSKTGTIICVCVSATSAPHRLCFPSGWPTLIVGAGLLSYDREKLHVETKRKNISAAISRNELYFSVSGSTSVCRFQLYPTVCPSHLSPVSHSIRPPPSGQRMLCLSSYVFS